MDNGMREPTGGELDEDLARRQAALRSLAQSATQQPPAEPAPPARATGSPTDVGQPATRAPSSAVAARFTRRKAPAGRRRVLAIGASVLAVAVIVAGGVVAAIKRAETPARAVPLVKQIDPARDGLSCVYDVAWSPDGARLAVLGDTQDCINSTPNAQTSDVIIFDAKSGRVIAHAQPDAPIYSAPAMASATKASTAAGSPPSLLYTGVQWTPDGAALLIRFNLFGVAPQGSAASDQIIGLLKLGISKGAQTAVWVEPQDVFQRNRLVRIDLSNGGVSLVPAPATATGYRWNSDGSLAPEAAPADGSIGSPDGGASFTIWQPGTLQYGVNAPGQNAPVLTVPQDIIWAAQVQAVSPDGRYCYPYVPSFDSLTPPSTKRTFQQEVSVAPRDKALLALAQQMTRVPAPKLSVFTLAAWRPDGHYLAVFSGDSSQSGTGPAAQQPEVVSLYAASTGKLVKRLTVNTTGLLAANVSQASLSWSPDGKRLLLFDHIYGAITIWGPGALPQ